MKIPKSVLIKGKRWRVRLVKDLRDEGESIQGLTTYEGRLIQIHADLKGETLGVTFWHEFIHAILWESHVSGNDGSPEDFVEEIICDAIGSALYDHVVLKPKRRGKRK